MVALAASSMRLITAPGLATMTRRGPLTWPVWASAWAATKRSRFGQITWSPAATIYQDGIVFQAGVPDLAVTAPRLSGRCSTAIAWASYFGSSLSRNV